MVILAAVLAVVAGAQPAPQQQPPAERREYIRAHYSKHEFLIPMRDGVRLFTAVYAPKDRGQTYPFLLLRTPYTVAPYGVDNYREALGSTEKYMREGFIFVFQDVRGRGKSEGAFVHARPILAEKRGPKDIDESTDTYDTIDWLVKNVPNNNGRAGMYGISYPGFYAALGAIGSHPALKATSPQAPVYDWFVGDDFRHNGVLFLAHAFNFFSTFGRPKAPDFTVEGPRFDMQTPDGYDFHLRTGPLANYDEKYFHGQIEFWKEFWKSRVYGPYLKNLKPAMMTVGGWFDAEDVYGPMAVYRAAEKQNPGAVNIIVEGPWSHGGWGREDGDRLHRVHFGSKTSQFFRDNIEFPFFLYHLKDKGDGGKLPEAYMFLTGLDEWRKLDAWPPRNARSRSLYFSAGGKLGETAPSGEAFDEYISDPAKPVPFFGTLTQGMTYDYMVEDQRFASSRTDVLVYRTEPLENNLTVAGPLKATLYVSTTGTDSDFVVKLIDVFPDTTAMGGYQQLVRGEPFRGKFRHGFDKPEPFTPGKVEKIEFTLPDIYHCFRRGHRIMAHVQSTWFPLADRNPQKFLRIHQARPEDFQKATQRLYRSGATASFLSLPVAE
jgi:putative CocE/NonD family hydrolase